MNYHPGLYIKPHHPPSPQPFKVVFFLSSTTTILGIVWTTTLRSRRRGHIIGSGQCWKKNIWHDCACCFTEPVPEHYLGPSSTVTPVLCLYIGNEWLSSLQYASRVKKVSNKSARKLLKQMKSKSWRNSWRKWIKIRGRRLGTSPKHRNSE